MELADVWEKIANNARLTPQELDFLKNSARETQLRNAFISGNVNAQNNLNISFPFAPIYSEVFQENKTSITISVPPNYKHLIIISAGRVTTGGVGFKNLRVQYNGDTGANYNNQAVWGAGAAVSASEGLGGTSGVIGTFSEDGNTAGKLGAAFISIPHYNSDLFKTSLSLNSADDVSSPLYMLKTVWLSAQRINTIKFFMSSGDIKSGSSLSMYGVN